MLVLRACPVAIGGEGRFRWNAIFRLAPVALAALIVGGCSLTPPAPLHAAAADPHVPVPAARYSSVVGPYARQRPVEPLPWREQNDRVAPQANP